VWGLKNVLVLSGVYIAIVRVQVRVMAAMAPMVMMETSLGWTRAQMIPPLWQVCFRGFACTGYAQTLGRPSLAS
jgi:hypothetical protein